MMLALFVTYGIGLFITQFIYWSWVLDYSSETPTKNFRHWKDAQKVRLSIPKESHNKSDYIEACATEKIAAQEFAYTTSLLFASFLWPIALVLLILFLIFLLFKALFTLFKNLGNLLNSLTGKF